MTLLICMVALLIIVWALLACGDTTHYCGDEAPDYVDIAYGGDRSWF